MSAQVIEVSGVALEVEVFGSKMTAQIVGAVLATTEMINARLTAEVVGVKNGDGLEAVGTVLIVELSVQLWYGGSSPRGRCRGSAQCYVLTSATRCSQSISAVAAYRAGSRPG